MNTVTVATAEAQKGFYPTPPALAEKPVEEIVFSKPHTGKVLQEVAT